MHAGRNDDQDRAEALGGIRGKRGGDDVILGAFVEVVREGRNRLPRGVREFIVAVHGPIRVAALLVKAETVKQFRGRLGLHETAVG